MVAALIHAIKSHIRTTFPILLKFRRRRRAKSNWDYFGDPKIFLDQALQNEYINKDTPEQIWRNLLQVCSDLKVPYAAERIAIYRQQHFGFNSETLALGGPNPDAVPYTHDEISFNMVAPRIIAGRLNPIFRPNSVIDVGCGLGTFLHAFKELGVETILGIDGDWVDRKLLSKHISPSEFRTADLQTDFSVDSRFDLVISLEVAEHLRPESAESFVKNLVALGDVILFSAATPLTWFDSSHVNNQWPGYWSDRFAAHGYIMQDVVRHIFHGNQDVCPWYRTNMFLVTKGKKAELTARLTQISPANIDDMMSLEACYPLLTTAGI
jgi:2-polyprenyl-3-methyl-5-hydroxy-6-metoxy-1,4-benzoquinol methylase